MASRIDGFQGLIEDYITYLEDEVKNWRRKNLSTTRSCDTSFERASTASNGEHSSRVVPSRNPAPRSKRHRPVEGAGHTSSTGEGSLQIVHFDPRGQPSTSKVRRHGPPLWKTNAKTLLDSTPKGINWFQAIREANLHDALDSGLVVGYLLDQAQLPPALRSTYESANSEGPAAFLRSYAQCLHQRTHALAITTKLINFQEFLFLSACAVLLKSRAITPEEVFNICRIPLGVERSDRYCSRVLDAAIYVNTIVDALSAYHWGSRAIELVLLWNKEMRFFYKLACSRKESFEYIKDSLVDPIFQLQPQEEIRRESREKGNVLFVPSLVEHLLGSTIHVANIARELGYSHAHMLAFNPLRAL